MTRAKVCGLTRPEDVAAAVTAGADAVGFVVDVSVDTPREVDPDRAADLVADVPPFVTTVVVTMRSDPDDVVALRERVGATAVQLHGDVATEDVAAVAEACPTLVAVDADDLDGASRFDAVADALLVDSADADGGGGTGNTHDWSRTREFARAVDSPVVLAGGLTPENVADAVATVEPYAVDVASGVEASGGEKDHDAVAAFLERATGGAVPVGR